MAHKELVATVVLQAIEDSDEAPLVLIRQALSLAAAPGDGGAPNYQHVLLALHLLDEVGSETVQGQRVSQHAALQGKMS